MNRRSLAACCLLASLTLALGQAIAQAPEPAPATTDQPKIRLEDLPPAVRLGLRVEVVRRQIPASPVVVIVPDVASYVAAIAQWRLDGHGQFPVLIDDGTWLAREDIARFVRAYQPADILRWSTTAAWPEKPSERQARIETALASAWGAFKDGTPSPEAYLPHLATLGMKPPGIIAASIADPAWTAALALAAGRGQVLTWVSAGGGIDAQMAINVADELSDQVTAAATATGLKWDALGDDLEAVTLCLSVPSRTLWPRGGPIPAQGSLNPVPGEPVATTDLIGRHRDGKDGLDRTRRWAWCGQIAGSASSAAYRAMCGLFLMPDRAWLFDGYDHAPPWNLFSATEAAETLTAAGIVCRVDRTPANGLQNWRERTAGDWAKRDAKPAAAPAEDAPLQGGLAAGLICVNTSGNSEDFNLKPGQGLTEDIPLLAKPAIVHFVHSWSAQYPGARPTIAGRWLERGTYAYVGSVHEPFLQAFQPTPGFVRRMLAPAPLGASARLDQAPPWRITVLGDPLLTLGPARTKGPAPTLAGAVNLRETLGDTLKAANFAEAFASLLMQARDADLVRLARALLTQQPEKLSPEIALLALGPAFRAADLDTFASLGTKAAALQEAQPMLRDMVWHALQPASAKLTAEQADLLGSTLRSGSYARDAGEASRVIRRLKGEPARRQYLEDVLARTTDAWKKKQIDALLSPPAPMGK